MPSNSVKLKYRPRREEVKVSKERQGTVPPMESDTTCDAILVTQSELGGDEEMKESANAALKEELDYDLNIDRTTDKIFVGNNRGLHLATHLRALQQQTDQLSHSLSSLKADMEAKNTSLEAKNTSLENRVRSLTTSLEAKNTSLEAKVRGLTISVDALFRNRFISCFRRDYFGDPTALDLEIITAGNERAHGGDALTDAQLYMDPDPREDLFVFKKLYGMDPSIAHGIAHKETLEVLNTHAEVIASNRKRGSDKFYALFKTFVELFKASKYNDTYLDGSPTDVTSAYHAFIDCIDDEVVDL